MRYLYGSVAVLWISSSLILSPLAVEAGKNASTFHKAGNDRQESPKLEESDASPFRSNRRKGAREVGQFYRKKVLPALSTRGIKGFVDDLKEEHPLHTPENIVMFTGKILVSFPLLIGAYYSDFFYHAKHKPGTNPFF